MPWDFGAGVAAAAGAGAGLIADSIKRERDLQGATDLEALKQKIEQDKQARIAAIVGGVSRTKDVPIAGPTVDGSSLGVESQPKPEGEYRRERGDALSKAGLIDYSEKEYAAADRHEENMFNRTTQAAKQKSDDEKWHATNAELIRHHKSLEAKAAAQLGLKDKEEKAFAAAVDSYITNKAQYESLRAEKGNDPDIIDAAKQAMEGDALKLKQYRVDVGDQSDLAKHMSLSATLASVNKTIETKTMAGEDTSEDKKTRDALSKKIGEIATGSKGGGSDVTFEMVNGKLVPFGGSKPATTGATKPASAAAAPVTSKPAKPYVPPTSEEARLSMQGRKKTGADKY